MEMEVPSMPKLVLDNLLASMRSSDPAPLGKHNNGIRQLPMPLFHGAALHPPASVVPSNSPASCLYPLQGGCPLRDLESSSPNLFKESSDQFTKGGSQSQPPVKEKPKRVRKSRGTALLNKSRALVPETNLEGVQQPQPPSTQRRRSGAMLHGDCETVQKPPPRKRNRTKAKLKEDQLLSFSTAEGSFAISDSIPNHKSFGIYGSEPKSLDLSCHMKDGSLERMMPSNLGYPFVYGKQGPLSTSTSDNSNFSFMLQNLSTTMNIDQIQPDQLLESKPFKLSLDPENSPLHGNKDGLGVCSFGPKFQGPIVESSASFPQERKANEAFSICSGLETVETSPANFWSAFQMQPGCPLGSVKAQPSTVTESRFFPLQTRSNNGKFNALPPPIFSLGSLHISQESSGDLIGRSNTNLWFEGEPPKTQCGETQSHSCNHVSEGNIQLITNDSRNDYLFKPKNGCAMKEGVFDIDLNKESPEAEAAAAHLTGGSMCAEYPNLQDCYQVPAVAQVKVDVQCVGACKDPDYQVLAPIAHEVVGNAESFQISECINAELPVMEREHNRNLNHSQADHSLEDTLDVSVVLQPNHDVAIERVVDESEAASLKKQQSIEQLKGVTGNVSSLPSLFVPEILDTIELCSKDVPYSPGMHVTAHILCEMANSSSCFYVEKGEKCIKHTDRSDNAHQQHPTKVARLSGLSEKEAIRTTKHMSLYEASNEENASKAHSKDAKDKLLSSYFSSSNGTTTEPWALTPPRHAQKNVCSRTSAGSQSSESDKSHCCPKDYRPQKYVAKTDRLQEQQREFKSSMKGLSSLKNKELKEKCKPSPKVTFLSTLPTKALSSVSLPRKQSRGETKQALSTNVAVLEKLSYPHSYTSENCGQLQNRNFYSTKNGCSIKSPKSRHMLPYLEEVRHVSK